jgi:hypothetical protein
MNDADELRALAKMILRTGSINTSTEEVASLLRRAADALDGTTEED